MRIGAEQRHVEEVLPTVHHLDEVVDLLGGAPLYLRFSSGPSLDRDERSVDRLSGAVLPGLSVNPLDPPDWWGGRNVVAWLARQIDTYAHLGEAEDRVLPWVLRGRVCGRGPDNEPLVRDVVPVALLDVSVVEAARRLTRAEGRRRGVDAGGAPDWQGR